MAGSRLPSAFAARSGKEHEIELIDRRLARIVKQVQELPGQELFQYVDEDGTRQPIDSADVNDYLREISGDEFTAKDFRTWAGTGRRSMALSEFTEIDSDAQRKKAVVEAIETVARRLGQHADGLPPVLRPPGHP